MLIRRFRVHKVTQSDDMHPENFEDYITSYDMYVMLLLYNGIHRVNKSLENWDIVLLEPFRIFF